MKQPLVLVSWIAVNNDPYEYDRGAGQYRLVAGRKLPGPTLTLLFDNASSCKASVGDVVLFRRRSSGEDTRREQQAHDDTVKAIAEMAPSIRTHEEMWDGEDPTDHRSIFEFLRDRMPVIRQKFPDRELIIHISPGTPSMQTIWVLMAETGFLDPPFRLVKSYRESERRGRPAVVPVELGIETFYKVYKASRPLNALPEDSAVVWDPARFRSRRMQELFAEARRFAPMNVPILLLGERGTGKTTLAGWIRSQSPFRRPEQDSHWPAVSCGQYDHGTMRSELFGYKKGAFTDAKEDHPGLLAAADGDTLFLDEIGDTSRDLQRLLIKALEEKRYLPLGERKSRRSEFRLLTATNVGMDVLRERLDPDFFDRISVVALRLPPLREVPEEIPWLWDMVHDEARKRAGIPDPVSGLRASLRGLVITRLQRHTLPGNVRDLFRVAYRIVAAQADVQSPMSPALAVEYGLQVLTEEVPRFGPAPTDAPTAMARACAERRSLDPVLAPGSVLATREIFREIRGYLAGEIRRLARQMGVPAAKLCDVDARTLRTWAGEGAGKTKKAVYRK